jgi:hypothetical protein
VGREVNCKVTWLGETAEAKVLLEAQEIILRGGIKVKIPRAKLTSQSQNGDLLMLTIDKEKLPLEMGQKETLKWLELLSKPPPTLASKFGIGPDKDLQNAFKVASASHLPLWCVYRKGKHVTVADHTIRQYLRSSGMSDTKTCGVSDVHTATRHSWPR